MFEKLRQRRVEGWMAQAREALREHDTDRARELGEKMLGAGWSGGYEVLALVLEAERRVEEGITLLQRGLEDFPSVWRLWDLLGSFRSDLGQHDQSLACYESALRCPEVDAAGVHQHAAVCLSSAGRHSQALAELDRIDEGERLRAGVLCHRVIVLNDLGRYEEALALGRPAAEEPALWEGEDRNWLAKLLAELGRATWKHSDDQEGAFAYAWKAIELNKANELAARLVREVRPRYSPTTSVFRCVVQGKWSAPITEEDPPPGFHAHYLVAASSPAEALELLRPFEPPDVRATLTLDKHEIVEPAPDTPVGVVSVRGGYTFFLVREEHG